jgi:hypothetical protein
MNKNGCLMWIASHGASGDGRGKTYRLQKKDVEIL